MIIKLAEKKPIILLLLLILTISCQEKHSNNDEKPDRLVRQQQGFRIPAEFNLEDPACIERTDKVTLQATTIHRWNGNTVEPLHIEDANLTSDGSTLQSAAISKTTYADTWIRICDGDASEGTRCHTKNGHSKNWTYSPKESKGPIRICNDQHEYDRHSYESMAVSAAYYTNKAHAKFAELAGSNEIPKINLSISPFFIDEFVFQYEKEEVRQREYITHNMAYFQKSGTNPDATIAVFPEDYEVDKETKGYFWDSLFALAHEYGHHIDISANSDYYQKIGLVWNPLTHSFDSQSSNENSPIAIEHNIVGSSAKSKIEGGMQEAFADLVAFYAAEGDASSFSGIPCLGNNRNLTEGSFGNLDEKAMTEDRFDILIGRAKDENVGCEPHYNDQHILGAILAYTADQFFERLIAVNIDIAGSKLDFDQRYKLTLNWMKHYRAESSSLELVANHSDRLKPISRAFAKTADDWLKGFPLSGNISTEQLKADLCQIYEAHLPVSPEMPWVDGSDACSI